MRNYKYIQSYIKTQIQHVHIYVDTLNKRHLFNKTVLIQN